MVSPQSVSQSVSQSHSSASPASLTARSNSPLQSRILRTAAAAICLVTFAPERTDAGSTDQVYSVDIPATTQQLNYGAPGSNPQAATFDIQVPQFDPALGTLTGVEFELWHKSQVIYKYESLDDTGYDHPVYLHGTSDRLTVTLPSSGLATLSITANSVFELDSPSSFYVYKAAVTTGRTLQVRYHYDPAPRR